MTKEMQKRLSSNFFFGFGLDGARSRLFAHYYFDAIEAYNAGNPCLKHGYLPSTGFKKAGVSLQDALLGINAHIKNDLPMVMYLILKEDDAWPDAQIMLRRRKDHDCINDVLNNPIDLALMNWSVASFLKENF
jgi:hypothetical protein